MRRICDTQCVQVLAALQWQVFPAEQKPLVFVIISTVIARVDFPMEAEVQTQECWQAEMSDGLDRQVQGCATADARGH